MNRRAFNSAIAGAIGGLLIPSWFKFRQRKMIDLLPFCDDYISTRYQIDKPFAQDGMAYGTDGRICVRTTLADVPQLGGEVRLPKASILPWWSQDAKWLKWPQERYFSDESISQCPECYGKGGFGNLRRCVRCRGVGFLPVGEDYERECSTCFATGWNHDFKCEYCVGSGWTTRPALQQVGIVTVAGLYDRKIRSLGDVEFAVPANEADPVLFRGDGFEGLVMGINMKVRQ